MSTKRQLVDSVWAAGLAVLLAAGSALSRESGETTTRAAMRGIFVALSGAYTYSLDPEAFEDPKNRGQITEMLRALSTNAHELESHGGGLDNSFDYLRRSLERDADDALSRFEERNYVGSRFLLSKITENCVTCHTKLPANKRFDVGAEFLKNPKVKDLAPIQRVNLEVATRQFDTALSTYEEVLAAPDLRYADLDLFGVFENYLKVSVGALSDSQRPAAALQEFAKRPDVPKDLREDVDSWIRALGELDLEKLEGEGLPAARRLIEEAKENTRSRSDRSELVDFIASITILHRYLASKSANDLEVAEGYYLLGVAESYVARSYWISETGFLLDKAIRQAPKSEVAKEAFAFLEEYAKSGYKVAQARPVPPELQANLDELRKLIEE